MGQVLVLRFDKMDISEHYLFASEVIPLFSDEMLERHGIKDYLVPLTEAYVEIEDVYNVSRKSDFTPQIQQKDRERDYGCATFKKKVEVSCRFGTPAELAAANALTELSSRYVRTARQSYTKGTTLIDAFLRDARSPKFAPHITTLGMNGLVAQIETFNNEFKELFFARATERLTVEQSVKLGQANANFAAGYREMRMAINALAAAYKIKKETANVEEFNALINSINSVTRAVQLVMTRRESENKRAKAAKEEAAKEETKKKTTTRKKTIPQPEIPKAEPDPKQPEQPEGGEGGGSSEGISL